MGHISEGLWPSKLLPSLARPGETKAFMPIHGKGALKQGKHGGIGLASPKQFHITC